MRYQNNDLFEHIDPIRTGYSEGMYNGQKYGITKSLFNGGKSIKIYAEELAGNDFISLNFYRAKDCDILKPCEMTDQKVIHFLKNVQLI